MDKLGRNHVQRDMGGTTSGIDGWSRSVGAVGGGGGGGGATVGFGVESSPGLLGCTKVPGVSNGIESGKGLLGSRVFAGEGGFVASGGVSGAFVASIGGGEGLLLSPSVPESCGLHMTKALNLAWAMPAVLGVLTSLRLPSAAVTVQLCCPMQSLATLVGRGSHTPPGSSMKGSPLQLPPTFRN